VGQFEFCVTRHASAVRPLWGAGEVAENGATASQTQSAGGDRYGMQHISSSYAHELSGPTCPGGLHVTSPYWHRPPAIAHGGRVSDGAGAHCSVHWPWRQQGVGSDGHGHSSGGTAPLSTGVGLAAVLNAPKAPALIVPVPQKQPVPQ
jgi:hypothetical protein